MTHCTTQKCFNSEGSYSCSCNPGYRVVASNPTRCEDVDECAGGAHGCSHACTNTDGGFRCECPPGFQVWSLASFEVSCQLGMNVLNQISSVSLLMTSLTALANIGLIFS